MKEEYMIYSKKDTNIHVKAFYSYTAKKFQNIDYSLSKQLDSIKKMKLYEIKIFQPSKYYENYKLTMDGFEQRYTLEALEVPDQKKFLSIFNRYLRDIGKSR
ncbi:hypothetical protein DCM91_16020 [Chitinophaga costaii]|nr:hypothetical protein DCM91_16020 [Chitinophaga costaii]